MIVHLTGTLRAKEPSHCIVDVGGVGYGVHVSLTTFGELPENGTSVSLPIYTYVREDQLVLYGFNSSEERLLFQRLIAVSGVGPRTALAVLSGLPPVELARAISQSDSARLTTIPGIGRKTAERMIVELKDTLGRELAALSPQGASPVPRIQNDTLSALTNLGYPRAAAERAITKAGITESMLIEEAIRLALKELCRA
jgi:Holliday junction DNA helicase RuvA